MKKITFLATALFATTFSFAQNYYNFSASQGTYTNLTNATSINNNQFWDYDDNFSKVALPFNVTVFGKQYSHFVFEDNYFLLVDANYTTIYEDDLEYTLLSPITANIQDRDLTELSSLSPISYKTEGSSGSRILKLEIKNAGLEEEIWNNETADSYLNYQIWIYENTNKIEYHYGSSYVNNLAYLSYEEDPSIIVAFGTIANDISKLGYLDGNSTNPTYNELETTDEDFEDLSITLSALPANGQIYTFSTNTLSSKNESKTNFTIYPIPTEKDLNISVTEIGNYTYKVTDVLGKTVLNGDFTNVNEFTIDTNNLNSGTYFIKINNTTKKFIKK